MNEGSWLSSSNCYGCDHHRFENSPRSESLMPMKISRRPLMRSIALTIVSSTSSTLARPSALNRRVFVPFFTSPDLRPRLAGSISANQIHRSDTSCTNTGVPQIVFPLTQGHLHLVRGRSFTTAEATKFSHQHSPNKLSSLEVLVNIDSSSLIGKSSGLTLRCVIN